MIFPNSFQNLILNIFQEQNDPEKNKKSETDSKAKPHKFEKLVLFMINRILIPHSNAHVERIFSIVNATKTDSRNLLEVTTVNSIIQVKAYYESNSTCEPNEEHYLCYRTNIKDI